MHKGFALRTGIVLALSLVVFARPSLAGKPEDVSGVVAFLCSDAAGYMTGQTLVVDGGILM